MIKTGVQQLCCGGCGHHGFRMFMDDRGLLAECMSCKSVSTMTVPQPKISIGYAEFGPQIGMLCEMKEKGE